MNKSTPVIEVEWKGRMVVHVNTLLKKTLCFKFAFLAQLVERLPCKKRVVGSSPTVGSNLPLWWNGRHFRFRI
jgi:hypothetical protein